MDTPTPDTTNDVTSEPASKSNTDVSTPEGLNSRTQSYTSVASSQVSKGSRLPDYDFGEDDKPGKYKKGSKKDDGPKKETKKESTTNNTSDKIDEKKDKKQAKIEKSKKSKEEKLKKTKDKKQEKNKPSGQAKKEKAVKPSGKDKKQNKKSKDGSENDAFQLELNSVVSRHKSSDESLPNAAKNTSRELSAPSKKHDKKKENGEKKLKGKKKSSSGFFPEKKKKSLHGKSQKNLKNNKKKLSLGGESSEASLSDITTDEANDEDCARSNGKNDKKQSKNNKISIKDKPTVVVVNDDSDDISDVINKRKMFLGICPILSKTEPLLYNCCLCCSLGAGSLITGIIFVLFCVVYLVIRAEEFKKRTVIGIWNGHHLLPDVWRVFLILGFMTASLCLIASLLLVVGSCLWGSRERYHRIRRVITFWFIATIAAVINNLGEAVFIQAMPNIIYDGFYHESDRIEDIKENNVRLWALTGLFTLFFVYISLVLVSYLRMLKYMDSPKIGTAPTQVKQLSDPVAGLATKRPLSSRRQQDFSERDDNSDTQVKTVTETKNNRSSSSKKSEEKQPLTKLKIPARASIPDTRPRGTISDYGDRIYMNTSFVEDDERDFDDVASDRSRLVAKSKPESFKAVLEELTNDPKAFDNISKPKLLKRIPTRRPRPVYVDDAIYMNYDPRPETPGASYTKVSKPLKRAASLSDIKSPVYDCPPPETDLKDIQNKKNQKGARGGPYGSGDTGFNSTSSPSSVASSVDGTHPDISEMERLAEELRRKQQALDKSGNCDPETAENLTQMALDALKLSERILQDVKSNENNRNTPVSVSEENREPIRQNLKLATSFFDELSRDPNAMTENPVEEMFRMYGKDLCSQNPEMVNRYLMSYKALQQNRERQLSNFPPDTGISNLAMNEQKPWLSILNPSEAIPAVRPLMSVDPMVTPNNPLLSSMSQSTMMSFNGEDPRMGHSAFTSTQPMSPSSQPFHTVSHAQQVPFPSNNFFPTEYPMQNSASYNAEPPGIGAPPTNAMVQHNPPPHYDQNNQKYPPHQDFSNGGYPYKKIPYDDYYYGDECPYSCCYSMYDDHESPYEEYGPYPSHYMGSDAIYGEVGMYTGPNWFPMGDPAYSIDPYNNPYEAWDEPAPPYSEKSSDTSYRYRPSTRGYESNTGSLRRSHNSKAGTSSRGYTVGSRGYSEDSSSKVSASRGSSYKSRSLPNLLDEDLYSERSIPDRYRSSHNLSDWVTENEEIHEPVSRSSSRRSKSRSSSRLPDVMQETTRDAFMKGYKAALKEALTTITAKKDEKNSKPRNSTMSSEDDFLDKLISQVSNRERSQSPDRSKRDGRMMTRTISSDSRFSNASQRLSRESKRFEANPFKDRRSITRSTSDRRSSQNQSRRVSKEPEPEKLPLSISRRTSKLSFRPTSRSGKPIFDDDYVDDYRSTSSVPPSRDELDDFGFPRRHSAQSSVGFKSLKSATSKDSDDILSTFDMMSSHEGRPSTRSRLSSRHSQKDKEVIRHNDERSSANYPESEYDKHFYNKLDLERAFPEFVSVPTDSEPAVDIPRGRGRDRDRPNGRERSRSHSATKRRTTTDVSDQVDRERSRSVNGPPKNDKEILWFMGDNESEPIYSEYEGVWTGELNPSSAQRPQRMPRTTSYPEQQRPGSFSGSKRKAVSFDKNPRMKEFSYRRTSWD